MAEFDHRNCVLIEQVALHDDLTEFGRRLATVTSREDNVSREEQRSAVLTFVLPVAMALTLYDQS